MESFLHILLISMLAGVLGGIPIKPGIYVYLHDIVLGFGSIYLLLFYRKKSAYSIPKLGTQILLFVSFAVLSLLVNSAKFEIPSLLTGSLYLFRWILYSALYIVLVQYRMPVNRLLLKLFQFGCAFGILGLLQFVLYPNLRFLLYLGWDPHYYRLFSTLLDPNFAGIILVFSVLLGYYLYSIEQKREYVFLIIFLVLCVYLTYSRSSYLALMVGMLTFIVIKKQWRVLAGIGIFLCCVLFIPRPGGNTLNLLRTDSTLSRFSNWGYSFQLFMQSPVFGHGFNMLRFIQTPSGNDAGTFVSHAAAGVDSSIYFLLITSGIFGFATYIYLLYSADTNKKRSNKTEGIHALYESSIASVVIHSLFVNSLLYPWVLLWIWILISAVELTYDR